MEGFTPSVLMIIILAVIIGFAVGCFFMKQREKIKEAKKKLHTSEQEHEEDEDNEYEEEIMNIVNEGHEQGAIMEGEARMITNIFEFGDKDVTDVMTSRKKIDAIDVNMSVEKALNYMLDEPYSRYPLYEDDIDNIVGVLYLKDVIDAYLNQKEATLSDIAREPFFVHQTMNLSVLFQEMQTKKIHMAIVIDEYSQTETADKHLDSDSCLQEKERKGEQQSDSTHHHIIIKAILQHLFNLDRLGHQTMEEVCLNAKGPLRQNHRWQQDGTRHIEGSHSHLVPHFLSRFCWK